MLGAALPARNNEWLNAGPTAWICFNADNGDMNFPMKMPIIIQTHEQQIEIFNIKNKQESCCEKYTELDLF